MKKIMMLGVTVAAAAFLTSSAYAAAGTGDGKICYKVKKGDVTPPVIAADTETDQFGVAHSLEYKKPFLLCAPVSGNGDQLTHTLCYKAKGDKLDPAPQALVTTTKFGGVQVFVKKPFLYCEDGLKSIVP